MKRTFPEQLVYWRLAVTKAAGKALIAVIMSIAQALNGLEWHNLSGTQQFITFSLALGAGWSVVDAFLDTTMHSLSDKEKAAIAKDTNSPNAVVETTTITEVKP